MRMSREIKFFFTLMLALAFLLPAARAFAASPCEVNHPLSPPNMGFKGQCPNCGMARPMWARTWYAFMTPEGPGEACSLHCLADMALKAGEDPTEIQVALYLSPEEMVPVGKAYYVVGSKAPGTMTMQSKPAFPSEAAAQEFAAACGGTVMQFPEAFELAKNGVVKENAMIDKKRLAKGKIVEPGDTDRCVVCGMFPGKYPNHRSQIQTKGGDVYQFCSNQCLFTFMDSPEQYGASGGQPFLVWVVDYPSGRYIGGRSAYYVVGSDLLGPMGYEPISFDKRAEAQAFTGQHGGKVLIFGGVTPSTIRTAP